MSRFSQILGKAQAYATRNPDKVANIAGKAGDFVNKRTKGTGVGGKFTALGIT